MTNDDASTIQALSAIAQTVLGVAILALTWRYGKIANSLLTLQTESQIEPAVSFELHGVFAEVDEPLNHVRIENHSPLPLSDLTLSAEIFSQFGQHPDAPGRQYPAVRHMGSLPDMAPQSDQLRCIDEFVDESLILAKIGPEESSVIQGVNTVFIRLLLKYRRKGDGGPFQKALLITVIKKPEFPRPMAAYIRPQLSTAGPRL